MVLLPNFKAVYGSRKYLFFFCFVMLVHMSCTFYAPYHLLATRGTSRRHQPSSIALWGLASWTHQHQDQNHKGHNPPQGTSGSRRKPWTWWTCHDDAMIYMSAPYAPCKGVIHFENSTACIWDLLFCLGLNYTASHEASSDWGILWLLGFAAHFGRDAFAGRCKDSHPYKNRKLSLVFGCAPFIIRAGKKEHY